MSKTEHATAATETPPQPPAVGAPFERELGPRAPLLERLRSTAHWQLTEGNGDDATHQALQEAIAKLERLTAALKKANDQAEHFEREWHLRGDEIERLRAALATEREEARRMCPHEHAVNDWRLHRNEA